MYFTVLYCITAEETAEGLARANGVWWLGHILRRDEDNVLRKALDLIVEGQRGKGRPRMKWRSRVEEEIGKVGLKAEDSWDRVK